MIEVNFLGIYLPLIPSLSPPLFIHSQLMLLRIAIIIEALTIIKNAKYHCLDHDHTVRSSRNNSSRSLRLV